VLAGVVAACLAMSCGGGSNEKDVLVATVAPSQQAPVTQAAGRPATTPAATAPATQTSNEPVHIAAGEGVTLRGHLFSAPGPKRRALVVASAADQKPWPAHAPPLAAAGIALLTFDIRGVGETGGSRNDTALDKDVELAVQFLKSRDYPLVYVLGVGPEGGLASIKVAARQDLAGLALYAAPASGRTDIAAVREPKLLMAAESNTEAAAALSTLAGAAPEPVRRVALASNPPANDPFSAADARQALIDFVSGR
jgi:hypothetical protein